MHPIYSVLILLLAISSSSSAAPRVLLVGVDGAAWSVIDPLVAAGELPNLAALMERGVHAELETVEPVISPTVWTSIATGRRPEAHGVVNFFGDARSVGTPTLFERLAVQGVRVGVYDYLFTWPPRALPAGFMVPGWLRRDLTTAPPDAFRSAGSEPGYRYSNRGITSRPGYFASSFAELERKPAQWQALSDAFEIEAGALTFYAIDALSHRFWADSYPEGFDAGLLAGLEPEFRDAVPKAYVGVDRALGQLLEALPPETTVLVASDHGFEAHDEFERRWSFDVADELRAAGFDSSSEAFAIEGQFGFLTIRIDAGPFDEREALLTRLETWFESFTDEDGEALFWAQPVDFAARPEGRERSLVERAKQWALTLFGRLLGIQIPGEGLHAMLVMVPSNGPLEKAWASNTLRIGERSLPASEVIYGDGFTGNHHETAVFLAAGGPVRAIAGRQRLHVVDIAPLFLWLAGGALPDDLEGALRTEWLDPEALAARPVREVPAASLERLPDPAAPEARDADVIEQLRSMGYVE